MSLDSQVHINSVDVGYFYSTSEANIQKKIDLTKRCIYRFQKELETLERYRNNKLSEEKALQKIRSIYGGREKYSSIHLNDREITLEKYIRQRRQRVTKLKTRLKSEVSISKGRRTLNNELISDKNKISIFESTLTRTLGIKADEMSDIIVIVEVYYYDILKDLILNGFVYKDEKYICYTASAGQIRTKKVVFIKESEYIKHQSTLYCGLSMEKINKRGGINTNKFLAYLALSNSATDLWTDFDIDRSIVVDDFENEVCGEVDYIDHLTFEVTRKKMNIPINHTDGCGMVLPSLSEKNMMIRLPWVKGMLASFPFDEFIQENPTASPIIKDIYGKEHNIIDEKINVIFTKSQFKMWEYYKSWEEYKKYYKQYSCSAGVCNVEEDIIPNAKLNYQMLQTLTDITNEELKELCSPSIRRIVNVAKNKDTMLSMFGAMRISDNKNSFQKSLNIYPELLSDPYTKETLKEIKKSYVTNARAGKIDIKGKYLFIVPDLYAFCEYLFLKDSKPNGILQDQEVYCSIYDNVRRLDCLRSPHLYREHAVRDNLITPQTKRWFRTSALYISSHDLISKILQCDFDGDKSLVIANPLFVSIADRNMEGILPLYYEMSKAGKMPLNSEAIYNGMIAAYSGGQIGEVSNLITKIWNSNKTDIDLELIKVECLYNNYLIDFAKTLYKPDIPLHIRNRIKEYSKTKVPYFFTYAKNKEIHQVEKINNSTINRLEKIIVNHRMSFDAPDIGKFDYRMLMKNPNVVENRELVESYKLFDGISHFKVNQESEQPSYNYIKSSVRHEMIKKYGDIYYITDVLVKELFFRRKSKYKSTFWLCFGDEVFQNIKRNLNNMNYCNRCGKRFLRDGNNQKYCPKCSKNVRKKYWNDRKQLK